MKQTISVIILLVLMAVTVGGAEFAIVRVDILRYEPTPVEQGNIVDVWLQIENIGTKADRVIVELVPEYPFSVPPAQPLQLNVGQVVSTEEKVVKYPVFIDPKAPNGDHLITFRFKYTTHDPRTYTAYRESAWVEFESYITVESQDAALVIEEYKFDPSPVVPGQVTTADIAIRNMGKIAVKNVDIISAIEPEHFHIIGSGTMKRIPYIESGEVEHLGFQFASDTDTEIKVYSIPITILFQDERNKEYNETAKISLQVNTPPEYSLSIDSTEFTKKTEPGEITLKIVNKGVVDMKYVNVKLLESPEYQILSASNQAYVGNLDSDDFETVDFIIKSKLETPQLDVQLEFKDPYNTDFKKLYNLPLRILTPEDFGKKQVPWSVIAIIVLAMAGAGYYIVRKRRKRHA